MSHLDVDRVICQSFTKYYRFCNYLAVRSNTDEELECKGPWIKLHRACYKFEKNQKSWDDAQTDCEQDGGKLVSIGSVAEFVSLSSVVLDTFVLCLVY